MMLALERVYIIYHMMSVAAVLFSPSDKKKGGTASKTEIFCRDFHINAFFVVPNNLMKAYLSGF